MRVRIYFKNGDMDEWTQGPDFAEYKVRGKALVFSSITGQWVGWYNLEDVQKFCVIGIDKARKIGMK